MESVARTISQIAVKAMLYEVSAGPKPGLVDRFSSNAHLDMDIFTFIDSAITLEPYFEACVTTGFRVGIFENPFLELKALGIDAEDSMLQATCGINTHKGLVFALGLICAAVGAQWTSFSTEAYSEWMDSVCIQVKKWLEPHFVSELKVLKNGNTYGSKQYRDKGALGARGQALSAYSLIRDEAYPVFKRSLEVTKLSYNDAMLVTLLHVITRLDDSNVLGKFGEAMLEESQQKAAAILACEHFQGHRARALYRDYCLWCLEKRVSHGGAADLVVLCVYFDQLFRKYDKKTFA